MGWWLTDKRADQQSSFMTRFDPRYWTVNFPRPMMASVTTIAEDALRVDTCFYKRDQLCGLIWDSEDSYDHPLLAYETNRDYRGLILNFRWRSSGVKNLDEVNGPTLTIEGRDEEGNAMTWYVRLWNYAQGQVDDAIIHLDFSNLDAGFLFPEEVNHVWAGDIDRMFISITSEGYDGSSTNYDHVKIGFVELSDIRSTGKNAVLVVGDAMVPEHDVGLATAYDDIVNLTPERLLQSARSLGYRGDIIHYVGMSHYMRLQRLSDDWYISQSALKPGEESYYFNQAAYRWHLDYAARALDMGYNIIWSLSYEIFDAYCWNNWKQRTESGSPALTGWVPPSTLLSPTHPQVINYLRNVARGLSKIADNIDMPIKLQIGEPWWWVTPEGEICLYDANTRNAFGDDLVSIPNVYEEMNQAQLDTLDRAGELLVESTTAIGQYVRNSFSGKEVTLYLLAFLPTIANEEAPEVRRANLPVGWAYPAFDILQLEDYDWVTSERFADRANAIALADDRLGYPISHQQYLAGFVPSPNQKELWSPIMRALEQVKNDRGTPTFLWAWPQIARDGLVCFPSVQELQRFHDIRFPTKISQKSTASVQFSTGINTAASGFEHRRSVWADARMSYNVGPGVASPSQRDELLDFFRARRGPAIAFRFLDPFDNQSCAQSKNIQADDQILGIGDGLQTCFQLIKRYGVDKEGEHAQIPGYEGQTRIITHPIASTIIISVGGEVVGGWKLETGGKIIFESPPVSGSVIRAGFAFDVPVRFNDDDLSFGDATFAAADLSDIHLIEVKGI